MSEAVADLNYIHSLRDQQCRGRMSGSVKVDIRYMSAILLVIVFDDPVESVTD